MGFKHFGTQNTSALPLSVTIRAAIDVPPVDGAPRVANHSRDYRLFNALHGRGNRESVGGCGNPIRARACGSRTPMEVRDG
jgi:hypothetical protein